LLKNTEDGKVNAIALEPVTHLSLGKKLFPKNIKMSDNRND